MSLTTQQETALQAVLDDRQQAILARSWSHYSGHPKAPLIRTENQPDDNLIISLARLIVDKGASFLFGKDVQLQVTGPDPEAKQDWLTEVWRRNKRAITLLKLATNGGIFGHAYARLVDREDGWPRIVPLDPQTVRVITDPDDVDAPWKFTITPPTVAQFGQTEPQIPRRTIIQNQSGNAGYRIPGPEKWAIIDQQMSEGGVWQQVRSADWPYPFCPVVHCQNLPKPNDFWGEADLPEDVLTLLDAISRHASHINKIIRLHAHPKIWARGMGSRSIDVAIDGVLFLPSETAELQALEMKSDLSASLNFFNRLLELLSFMVRIPMVAMGEPDNLGSISGVALQIRYQPLLEKTESKRLTYGDMLTELDRCLLSMGGFGDTTLTELTWPELLPSDPLAERQVWVLDESLGLVSKETLSTLAGYTWDKEQAQIQAERQSAIAAGLAPDPTAPPVPPPAPIVAPFPDIAKNSHSS